MAKKKGKTAAQKLAEAVKAFLAGVAKGGKGKTVQEIEAIKKEKAETEAGT